MEKLIYSCYEFEGGYCHQYNISFKPSGRWKIDDGLLYLEHRGLFGITRWFSEKGLHFIPPEPVINCCRAS